MKMVNIPICGQQIFLRLSFTGALEQRTLKDQL
jgi:hypothetical protein